MSDERPTVRPVNLGRLVELAYLCARAPQATSDVVEELDVSKRRAREAILESERLRFIGRRDGKDEYYATTKVGDKFIEAVKQSDWSGVSSILASRSPHYGMFLDLFEDHETIDPERALELLDERDEFSPYKFNQTSLDVIGGWGQRLGSIQRNAFTGMFYKSARDEVPSNFPHVLLSVVDKLEESAGINLKQRYLSIPELREHTCERLGCERGAFDEALKELAQQNVGRVELSGAPIDTGAKEAQFGIKTIELNEGDDGLVSTDQSSELVMRGVEQLGKQYYYLAVYNRDLQFDNNE